MYIVVGCVQVLGCDPEPPDGRILREKKQYSRPTFFSPVLQRVTAL